MHKAKIVIGLLMLGVSSLVQAQTTPTPKLMDDINSGPIGVEWSLAAGKRGSTPLSPCSFFNVSGQLVLCSAANPLPVTGGTGGGTSTVTFPSSMAVTGTFWQATQPISVVSLPLPSGAGTAANQTNINSTLSSINTKLVSDTNGLLVVGKGGSNIATAQVSVGTSATVLASARTARQKLTFQSTAATAYCVGPSTVTISTGFCFKANDGAGATLDFAGPLYAIVASGTLIVGVMETY